MEMNKNSSDLVEQTEKYLKGIHCWTLSELLVGLKQCQNVISFLNSSLVLHELLDILVGRLCAPNATMHPCTDSMRNHYSQPTWWFQDLVFLNIDLLQKVIKKMLSQKFESNCREKQTQKKNRDCRERKGRGFRSCCFHYSFNS
uniref:Uncharacterized protein n=1 Tax=Davidia involucrata TaxID=16924 RepID=A0A5B7BFL6_DAVIN